MVCKVTHEYSSPNGMGVQWVGTLSDSVEAELVEVATTAALRLIENHLLICLFIPLLVFATYATLLPLGGSLN